MTENRRSYSDLIHKPAWLLITKDGTLVASVRAFDRNKAKQIFARHGLKGVKVMSAEQWQRERSVGK